MAGLRGIAGYAGLWGNWAGLWIVGGGSPSSKIWKKNKKKV